MSAFRVGRALIGSSTELSTDMASNQNIFNGSRQYSRSVAFSVNISHSIMTTCSSSRPEVLNTCVPIGNKHNVLHLLHFLISNCMGHIQLEWGEALWRFQFRQSSGLLYPGRVFSIPSLAPVFRGVCPVPKSCREALVLRASVPDPAFASHAS